MVFRTCTYNRSTLMINCKKIRPNIPISHTHLEEHTRSSQSVGGVIFSSLPFFHSDPTARVSRPFFSLSPHTFYFITCSTRQPPPPRRLTTTTTTTTTTTVFLPSSFVLLFVDYLHFPSFSFVYCFLFIAFGNESC